MALENSEKLFLKNAILSGYKSIENVNVDLERGLNIIIGKNAAGKTNFLKFLYKCLSLNYDDLSNFSSELFFVNGQHIKIKASKSLNVNEILSSSALESNTVLELFIGGKLIKDRKDSITTVFEKLQKHNIIFDSTFLCHGVPNDYLIVDKPFSFRVEKNGTSNEITKLFSDRQMPYFIKCVALDTFLRLYNFSTVTIEEIKKSLNEVFAKIESLKHILSKFSPIQDIRFSENYNIFIEEGKEIFTVNNLYIEFKIDGSWLPFSNLSDGTKRLFYIISEVADIETISVIRPSSNRKYFDSKLISRIILIEEPELGIHPHQFQKLMNFLKDQSQHKQILISTHSPQALDSLQESEFNRIIIAFNKENEGTQMRHLTNVELAKANEYIKEDFLSDYWLYSDLEK